MALSRSLVFPALFLSLFALWLEDEHIFWAIPLAEALTLLLGIGLLVGVCGSLITIRKFLRV